MSARSCVRKKNGIARALAITAWMSMLPAPGSMYARINDLPQLVDERSISERLLAGSTTVD